MRELIVYSCYALGAVGLFAAVTLLINETFFASLYIFFASISVFAIGFVCDKLAGIEEALLAGSSAQSHEIKGKSGGRETFSEPRFEDGMAVIDTATGPKRFPNMTEAKKYVTERSS